LLDLVTVRRKSAGDQPPRAYSDYEVMIAKENLPAGLCLEEKI
jgi:hypothetical protein